LRSIAALPEAIEQVEMSQNAACTARRRPRRILIVEDEPILRMAFAEAAREAGYAVIEAANPQGALQHLASEMAVDLVFSDIYLPGGMDGLALARRIRADYPGVKILLTSGRGIPPGAPTFGPFIAKPYATADLLSRIERHLEADGG